MKLVEDEALARLNRPASMPPRVNITDVEFIEFATTEEEAGPLGTMLATMGFEPVGRHVSKAVTRWRQGGINIVLNSETEGFAHSHSIVHGASACALALRVRDVPAALDRAKALHVPRFDQAVGPGEMNIPGVRGVGGSLIYFIEEGTQEQVWRNDFLPLTEAPVTGAGLIRFDHIAQAMGYEEFLFWLLYYFALFDVTKTRQLEIADPLGIVHSQAIENVDRSLRFTLNGSAAAQTLTSRFLNHYLGAGVQHVALATDDIFATPGRCRNVGCNGCPFPATIMMISRPGSGWTRTWWRSSRRTTSFLTAARIVNSSSSIPAPSPSASSSNSWNGVATTPMAWRTPRCGWRRSHVSIPIRFTEGRSTPPATR